MASRLAKAAAIGTLAVGMAFSTVAGAAGGVGTTVAQYMAMSIADREQVLGDAFGSFHAKLRNVNPTLAKCLDRNFGGDSSQQVSASNALLDRYIEMAMGHSKYHGKPISAVAEIGFRAVLKQDPTCRGQELALNKTQ